MAEVQRSTGNLAAVVVDADILTVSRVRWFWTLE
jgi:hypothetical protein